MNIYRQIWNDNFTCAVPTVSNKDLATNIIRVNWDLPVSLILRSLFNVTNQQLTMQGHNMEQKTNHIFSYYSYYQEEQFFRRRLMQVTKREVVQMFIS